MSGIPWGVAAAGMVLSAMAAVADGALLAEAAEGPDGMRRDDGGLLVGGSDRDAWRRRERVHRALAVARVAGLVVAGGGTAWALGAPGEPHGSPWTARLWGLLGAGLLLVTVVEGLARAVGDALGARALDGTGLAAFVRTVERAGAPLGRLGDAMEQLLHALLPDRSASAGRRQAAAEQFRDVVTAEPDVSREERSLLLGVFSFGETTAEEVMVPRVDIVGIARGTPWSEVVDRVRSERHSRIPVFDGTIDEVVGILYAKDLLGAVVADAEPAGGWEALVRPVDFIPAAKRIADLLREFRQSRRHMAIVADEYGGTAGLVTIEDVLEELVGEIRDEYDEEERPVESEAGTRYWVSGRLTLDDLSDAVGVDLRRDDVSTVGGLVLELLGRVPRAGEVLTVGPFRAVVERVVRRKVARVFLERLPQADGTVAEGEA